MERRTSYDYEEFSQPVGGWLRRSDKPTPARTDRAFRIGADVVGLVVGLATLIVLPQISSAPPSPTFWAILLGLATVFAALAYGFIRAIGMIVVGIVGAIIDGPEWAVNWGAMLHDLRMRSVWAALLEVALFLAAAAMMLFSLLDAVRTQSAYSAAVFLLLAAMTWWPFIRHRIRFGRWPA